MAKSFDCLLDQRELGSWSRAVTSADGTWMTRGFHSKNARVHKKQLEKLKEVERYTDTLIKKYEEKFPSVGDVVCHCTRHKSGCGCMSNQFIERARNNFSLILSISESAEEFATKIRALARHGRNEHEWDGGRCDFHQP